VSPPAHHAAEKPRAGRRRGPRGGTPGDLVAGVSVALVLIPQSLAYAELAGMPAYRGLFASTVPLLAAALLASSPYLQTGPVAITSLLTLAALSGHAPPGSSEYVALGLLLALVVGITRVALGLLRGGVLAYLLSQPMLAGFMPAAAILIAAAQLPVALGSAAPGDGLLADAAWALVHPASWQPSAMLLAATTLALMLGGRRVSPLFPGVLLAVAAAIGFGHWTGYGGSTVGPIPAASLPLSVELPWSALSTVLVPGVIIALVGFAEPASIARSFATEERTRWDPDRELVSQGAANVASALTGGFPVGGSFSRSSLNRLAGARTRLSGAVTGLVVLAFLPFAGVLAPLPRAVLAAIVIGAVLGLIRLGPMLALWRFSRPQWAVASLTFALTLALAPRVDRAVLLGVALAVAVHLWRELHLDVEAVCVDETLVLRPQGVLWFGSAQTLEQRFVELLAGAPDARRLELHLASLGRIDVTGALALRRMLDQGRRSGLEVEITGVQPAHERLVRGVVEADGEPG